MCLEFKNGGIAMKHVDPADLAYENGTDAELQEVYTFVSKAISKAAPYFFRTLRAFAYAMACYLLLWLQPHFDLSYTALASAIFFLALVRRTTFLAEAALILIFVSVFVPVGAVQSLLRLF